MGAGALDIGILLTGWIRRRMCVLAAAAMVSLAMLSGCGDDSDNGDPPVMRTINEQAGTYRGVGFLDSAAQVTAEFGPPPTTDYRGNSPLRTESDEGAPVWDCRVGNDRRLAEFMRYDNVSFALSSGKVCDFVVVEEGAATQKGVAIGDALAAAQRAYPGLTCGVANEGTDYPEYPYCAGKLADRRYVWFGGDPISTIQLNLTRFGYNASL